MPSTTRPMGWSLYFHQHALIVGKRPLRIAANSHPARMAVTVRIGEQLTPLIVRGTGFGKDRGVTSRPKLFYVWIHTASAGESFRLNTAKNCFCFFSVVSLAAVWAPDPAVTNSPAMGALLQWPNSCLRMSAHHTLVRQARSMTSVLHQRSPICH